jgi:hypothetical protein
MKNIVLVLLLVAGYSYAQAQDVYTSSGKPGYQKKMHKKKKGYDPERLIVGGNLIAGFGGGYADVGIAPIVGYRFTNRFSMGIGLGYQYVQQPDAIANPASPNTIYYDRENLIYPSLWSRFFVWRNWYVTGTIEDDIISLKEPVWDVATGGTTITSASLNVNVPALLLGGGIRMPMGGRLAAFLEADFEVLGQKYSPYIPGQPDIRMGFAAGL